MLLSLGVFSCKKKEDPVIGNNDPVFFLAGDMIGRGSFNYVAGQQEYYMFADFRRDNTNNLVVFSGEMRKAGCTNCKDFFNIEIYNNITTAPGQPVDIDNSLVPGAYSFNGTAVKKRYKVTFVNESSGMSFPAYTWDFGNSMTSPKTNPQMIYNDSGYYEVSLQGTGSNCGAQAKQKIFVGEATPPCHTQLLYTRYTVDSMKFFAIHPKPAGFNYIYDWDFGDGNQQTTSTDSVAKKYYSGNAHQVRLITTSPGNCSDTTYYNVNVAPAGPNCAANFRYNVELLKGDNIFESSIKITYVDPSGKYYASNTNTQPSASTFQVISTEGFGVNEKGEKTLKVKVAFSCRLFFSSTDYIDLKDVNGIIAIAYP